MPRYSRHKAAPNVKSILAVQADAAVFRANRLKERVSKDQEWFLYAVTTRSIPQKHLQSRSSFTLRLLGPSMIDTARVGLCAYLVWPGGLAVPHKSRHRSLHMTQVLIGWLGLTRQHTSVRDTSWFTFHSLIPRSNFWSNCRCPLYRFFMSWGIGGCSRSFTTPIRCHSSTLGSCAVDISCRSFPSQNSFSWSCDWRTASSDVSFNLPWLLQILLGSLRSEFWKPTVNEGAVYTR